MLFQAEVSDYQIYPGLSEPALFIAQPVFKRRQAHRRGGAPGRQQGDLSGLPGLQRPGRDRRDRWSACSRATRSRCLTPVRHDPDAAFRRRVKMGDDAGHAVAARRPGPARLRRGDRLPRRARHGGLVVRAGVPLGPAGQAGQRRGVRHDQPAAAGVGHACSWADRGDGGVGGLAGGPVDHPADPPGRPDRRPRGRRRPDDRRTRARRRARWASCSRRSAR